MANFENISEDELTRLLRETSGFSQLVEQQAGFERVTERLPLEEALARPEVGAQLRNDLRNQQNIVKELRDRAKQKREAGTGGVAEVYNPPTALLLTGGVGGGIRQTADQMEAQADLYERENVKPLIDRVTLITRYQKTPERKEQEKVAREFQRLEQERYRTESELFKTQLSQLQEQQERNRELFEQYGDVLGGFAERQLQAQQGQLPVSQATITQRQEDFDRFKQQRAAMGQIITGDTPEEAVAQGSNAEAALQQFNTGWNLRMDREKHGMMATEAGILQTGIAQAGALGGAGAPTPGTFLATTPGVAGTLPAQPSTFGLQATGLAMRPRQFNVMANLKQQALIDARRQGRGGAGISPFGGALSGASIGSAFGPWGAAIGAGTGLLGSQLLS